MRTVAGDQSPQPQAPTTGWVADFSSLMTSWWSQIFSIFCSKLKYIEMIISTRITRTSWNDSWLVSHPSWLFVSCVCVFFVFKITYEPARITVGSLAEALGQICSSKHQVETENWACSIWLPNIATLRLAADKVSHTATRKGNFPAGWDPKNHTLLMPKTIVVSILKFGFILDDLGYSYFRKPSYYSRISICLLIFGGGPPQVSGHEVVWGHHEAVARSRYGSMLQLV